MGLWVLLNWLVESLSWLTNGRPKEEEGNEVESVAVTLPTSFLPFCLGRRLSDHRIIPSPFYPHPHDGTQPRRRDLTIIPFVYAQSSSVRSVSSSFPPRPLLQEKAVLLHLFLES